MQNVSGDPKALRPSDSSSGSTRLVLALFYACIAAGVSCAIFQYFYNRSLWVDEASLSNNIINRSIPGLLEPLDNLQVAPIAFLITEKIIVLALGPNEFALRLFPMICFLLSIAILYHGVKNLTGNTVFALMTTAAFSITFSLISYASEVKQYSVDVLCAALFLWMATYQGKNLTIRFIVLSVIGGAMIWFSNIAVILLFTLGLFFIWNHILRKQQYGFIIPLFSWAVAFGIYYVFFIHGHPSKEGMQNYWSQDFMPLEFSARSIAFIKRGAGNLFGYLLGTGPFWRIASLIFLIGVFFTAIKKQYKLVYLCMVPLVVHLLLSGFHYYPFRGRLILYLVPFAIVFMLSAVYHGFHLFKHFIPRLPDILLVIPVIVGIYPLTIKMPVEREEIKKSLDVLNAHAQPNEQVYVYRAAQPAFEFYQKTGYYTLNNPMVYGNYNRDDYSMNKRDLQQLTGHVWLLFAHAYNDEKSGNEEHYIINYLKNNGTQILGEWQFTGSSTYYIQTGLGNQ